jgi:hypothetical protein
MNRTQLLTMALVGMLGTACGDDEGHLVDAAQDIGRDASPGVDADAPLGPDAGLLAVDTERVAGADAGAMDSGDSEAGTAALTFYDVVETFLEPMTQPNNTVFAGSFAFDTTTKTVSSLNGLLTESMTKVNGAYGGPMTTVSLTYQLSSVPVTLDGTEGFLVTTFALPTTATFTGGGFAPGGTEYYGLLEGIPNNHNAYAMIFVNTADPTAPLTQAQIDKLAYADCTAGGMMMNSCMTGTTVAGYGAKGTMMGYPVSQVITKR